MNGLVLGAKYMGRTWDADFGFALLIDPDDDDDDGFVPLMPLISIHRQF